MINKNKYNNNFLSVCISLGATFFPLASSYAESLNDAVRYAVDVHPTIMASQSAKSAAEHEVQQKRSDFYPQASIGATFGRIYSNNSTSRGLSTVRGAGYSWYGDGSVNLNQTLYDFSARSLSVDAAKARYGASDAQYYNDRQSIAGQATQAYIQLLRAQTLLNIATLNDRDMEMYLERIRAAFDNGGADGSQVSRAQDYVSLAKNSLVQYEGDYQIALAYYKESLGRAPDGALLSPPMNDLSHVPDTIDDVVRIAIKNSPQIKNAHFQQQANKFDQKREETNILPTLNAELSYQKVDQDDLIGGESEDARALLRANWDYAFGGGQIAAQDRAAMLEQQAVFNRDAVERSIARDAEVSWINLKLVRNQMRNNLDRFIATEKTYETYKVQYEGGQLEMLDLMAMGANKYTSQMDYMGSTYQEMAMLYSLMSIMGIPFYEEQGTMTHVITGEHQ